MTPMPASPRLSPRPLHVVRDDAEHAAAIEPTEIMDEPDDYVAAMADMVRANDERNRRADCFDDLLAALTHMVARFGPTEQSSAAIARATQQPERKA
jgi:hypothetical protein